MGVEGRVVVITGVTSGFGRNLALAFAEQGALVVGNGRRADRGESLATEVAMAGGSMTFVPGDVAQVADCEALIRAAVDRHGTVDILVNNAGTVGHPAITPAHETTEAVWDSVLDTNLKGTFFCSKFALQAMVPQGRGVIFNIVSVNGVLPMSGMSPYNCSKAAIIHLTKTQAIEYLRHGVRSYAVVLGPVEGETNDQVTLELTRALQGPDATPVIATGALTPAASAAATMAALAGDEFAAMSGASINLDACLSLGLLNDLAASMLAGGVWHYPQG